jgi:hypothetical protein
LFKAKALQTEKESTSNKIAQLPKSEGKGKTKANQPEQGLDTNEGNPNIYTDAAWKCSVTHPKANYLPKEKAGIGIYVDWRKSEHKIIYVQAVSSASSALQAEAQALELAAQIGKTLNAQEPNFLTDNLILAQALQRKDPTNHPGHWIIRPNLHQFIHHTQGIQARIYKIKRDVNNIAHKLAQEAVKIQNLGACTYTCTKHLSYQCPVIAAISKLNVQPCTLISVTCL